jgi:hypothetical protein
VVAAAAEMLMLTPLPNLQERMTEPAAVVVAATAAAVEVEAAAQRTRATRPLVLRVLEAAEGRPAWVVAAAVPVAILVPMAMVEMAGMRVVTHPASLPMKNISRKSEALPGLARAAWALTLPLVQPALVAAAAAECMDTCHYQQESVLVRVAAMVEAMTMVLFPDS